MMGEIIILTFQLNIPTIPSRRPAPGHAGAGCQMLILLAVAKPFDQALALVKAAEQA